MRDRQEGILVPLRDVEAIELRLGAVAELERATTQRANAVAALRGVGDLERLTATFDETIRVHHEYRPRSQDGVIVGVQRTAGCSERHSTSTGETLV